MEQLSQEFCLSDFATFIATLATDTKDKIRRSIFAKANAILGEFSDVVDGVAIDFAKLFSTTQSNIDSLEVNIDKVCEANRQRFHSIVSNNLQVFINQLREDIQKKSLTILAMMSLETIRKPPCKRSSQTSKRAWQQR